MSAALDRDGPQSAALIPDVPIRFAVLGRLLERPIVATHPTTHEVTIYLAIEQRLREHQQAYPLVAAYRYHDTGDIFTTQAAAEALAHRMAAAGCALVVGVGLELGKHHGRPALHLVEVHNAAAAIDTELARKGAGPDPSMPPGGKA